MLSSDTVAFYLLERGFVDAGAIVEGDLLVVDSSRRNSNFKVASERGPSYLVKQGFGPRRMAGIANEASIYRLLQRENSASGDIARYMPVFRFYDSEDHIMVTELLPAAAHLGDHQRRTGRFSTGIASEVGKALVALHTAIARPHTATPAGANLLPMCEPPWVLSAHHTTISLYKQLSIGNLQLLAILQQMPRACGSLDELRRDWERTALIHYDIKLENIVITGEIGRAGRRKKACVKLVDWEVAGIGDPLWDVGAMLGEYLGSWLLSIPVTGNHPPDRFLELARHPLVRIQPAIRSFWQAYAQHAFPHGAMPAGWAGRAASYAAVRLIQTAIERGQMAAGLTGEVLCLLQVAINILDRPEEAAVQLLGMPPKVSWRVPVAWVPAS